MVDLCTGSGAIAAAVADEVPHARVHAVELDRAAPAPGPSATWPAPASTCAWATSRRPSTTWPAPSTSWCATRRTSRWRPGSRWPPRPATTTRTWRCSPATTASTRSGSSSAARPCCCGPGECWASSTPTPRASRCPAVLAGHRALARGARPPRPGRACAVHDRPTGTMTGVSEPLPDRHRRGARGRRRGGQPGPAARRAGRDPHRHRLRPGRRRLRRRRRRRPARGQGPRPRDAAAGAGQLRRPPSTRWRSGCPPRPARWSRSSGPAPLTLVCHQQTSLQWDLGDTRGTVAVRMPDHAVTLEILERTGPLAVSSANLTGTPAATDADQAEEMLGERRRGDRRRRPVARRARPPPSSTPPARPGRVLRRRRALAAGAPQRRCSTALDAHAARPPTDDPRCDEKDGDAGGRAGVHPRLPGRRGGHLPADRRRPRDRAAHRRRGPGPRPRRARRADPLPGRPGHARRPGRGLPRGPRAAVPLRGRAVRLPRRRRRAHRRRPDLRGRRPRRPLRARRPDQARRPGAGRRRSWSPSASSSSTSPATDGSVFSLDPAQGALLTGLPGGGHRQRGQLRRRPRRPGRRRGRHRRARPSSSSATS